MLQRSDDRWPTWTTKTSVPANNVAARSGSHGSSLYRRHVVALNVLGERSVTDRRLSPVSAGEVSTHKSEIASSSRTDRPPCLLIVSRGGAMTTIEQSSRSSVEIRLPRLIRRTSWGR